MGSVGRSQATGLKASRLVFWSRLLLAVLTLLALLVSLPLLAGALLVFLFVLLVLPNLEVEEAPADAPSLDLPPLPVPLVEEVTRQLSASMSIGQVADIVLRAALHSTQAELATLALPVEVDHFTTFLLWQDQETVQIIHQPQSGNTLIEQAFQQGRSLTNREHTEIAAVLCHEFLIIGVLCIEHRHRAFSTAQADILYEIAVPTAVSLHSAHLVDEQQHQIDTLNHLQALTIRLAGVGDRDAVAQAVLETTRDILGAQEVALYHYQDAQFQTVMSLHRDRISRVQHEKRLTQTVALKAAQLGKVQIARHPITCVAVPLERNGGSRGSQVIAAAFIEHHKLRQRDLSALTLLAYETAAHLDTVDLHEQVLAVSDRLRITINSARDGVLMFDQEDKLIECNPAAERFLGIKREAFIGKHFVSLVHDMMRANSKNGFGYSRTQLTELARQMRLDPNRVTRRQFEQVNGSQRMFIEEIGSPVINSNNQMIGRLLVLRDVTEQKMLADFRDEITNMAVHDLRGPLTAVINGIDMTLKTGLTEYPEDNERVLRLSLDSARSLMGLVNSLLDIAKLESQRIPIHPQPVIASDLVENARKALENSMLEAEIEMKIALDSDLPPILVDADLMRRVLVNLLDNAVRFTPKGGSVLISAARADKRRVHLSVHDSGVGVPQAEREQIFEQYRQSKTNKPLRGSNGTGLGLTFCKLAVEAHGGKIWVEDSDKLSGASFLISVPIVT
jgi:PAS domain S-box-containing protein